MWWDRPVDLHTVSGPIAPADRDAVLALAARAAATDGVAPLDEAALLALDDPASPALHLLVCAPRTATPRTATPEVHGVLASCTSDIAPSPSATSEEDKVLTRPSSDVAGGMAGYAQVDRGGTVPTAQVVVAPAERRRGIGRALLDGAVAAAGGALEVWAHGDLPAARALAASAGFVRVHELWRMALDLRGRPAGPGPGGVGSASGSQVVHPGSGSQVVHPGSGSQVVHPGFGPGFVVRPFTPGHDEEAWLALNARAFADHPDQGRWTAHDLAAREREPWFEPAGFLLAERADGTLAGFVWTKVHPAGEMAPEPVGELYVLGVDPSAQGAGLGRALTAAGLDHLVGRGLRTAVLWVAGDNAAAIRTYRRAGFERAALDVRYARRPEHTSGSPDGATMGS